MIDILNHCDFTHNVCIGNHESDISDKAFAQRIEQSNFCWVNSNMRELDEKLNTKTSPYEVVEVTGRDGEHSRRVGLLGLLIADPAVYRPGSFGGATIEPVMETAKRYMNDILPQEALDLVVPLTHQFMEGDRELANEFTGDVFPIIVGGHEHEPFDETHSNSRIIKTGSDAINTAIIDIKWEIEGRSEPTITVDLIPTTSYPPDPDIAARVHAHQRILEDLDTARLFRFEDWLHGDESSSFSTTGNRFGHSNGTEALCSMLRMSMHAKIGLINAGSIRGDKVYPLLQEWFTWKDLKNEIAFPTEMVAVEIPGNVIEDIITKSRKGAKMEPPIGLGGFLHHCDQVGYNVDSCKIESIGGDIFDPELMYLTALPANFLLGMDNHEALMQWVHKTNLCIDEERGKPAKLAIVEMFSALMWLDLGSFDAIDKNGDGVICRADIKRRASSLFGVHTADLVADSILGIADLDGDGCISPLDMMVVRFVATDMMNHVATHEELQTMKQVVSDVLGKRPSHVEVKKVVKDLHEILDFDGSGKISTSEVSQVLGEVRRRSLLM